MLLSQENAPPRDRHVNLVFMGMGEPMDNLDAVLDAFDILTDQEGMGLSWRRITISSVGHVEGIHRLAIRERRPRLAVSLNATRDRERDRLMPVNRKWPLAQLRAAIADYPSRPGEYITFEYVLLAGVNDADHVRVVDGELRLSELFFWFDEDFEREAGSIQAWLQL